MFNRGRRVVFPLLLVKFWGVFRWGFGEVLFVCLPKKSIKCSVMFGRKHSELENCRLTKNNISRDVKRRIKWLKTSHSLKHSEIIISECWLACYCWASWLTSCFNTFFFFFNQITTSREIWKLEPSRIPSVQFFLMPFGDSYHLTFSIDLNLNGNSVFFFFNYCLIKFKKKKSSCYTSSLITESWDGWSWKRPLERSSDPSPLLKQGHPQSVA